MNWKLLALVLGSSSPAYASGETLWQNITEGMSVDQVHALYPAAKGQVEWHLEMTELKKAVTTGKCRSDVHIRHDASIVKSVVVFRSNKGMLTNNCPTETLLAMQAKYGEPLSHHVAHTSFLGTDGEEDTYIWRKDRVSIVLVLHGDAQNGAWDLKYVSTADLEATAAKDASGL
jgi:hypothetical protein